MLCNYYFWDNAFKRLGVEANIASAVWLWHRQEYTSLHVFKRNIIQIVELSEKERREDFGTGLLWRDRSDNFSSCFPPLPGNYIAVEPSERLRTVFLDLA
jgi:hypothetical protein